MIPYYSVGFPFEYPPVKLGVQTRKTDSTL
jgi:hypothetical protein